MGVIIKDTLLFAEQQYFGFLNMLGLFTPTSKTITNKQGL